MISNPKGTMTWYYESQPRPVVVVESIFRTPQFSSMADRYQDDGFGNGIDTNTYSDIESLLFHVFEDLH